MKKIILTIIVLILVSFAYAAIPNPGHKASEIGGDNDAQRTFNNSGKYTFPTDLSITGDVGIGITSPTSEELHVEGATNVGILSKATDPSSYSKMLLGTNNADNAGYMIAYGSTHGSQANQLSIKSTYGDMTFYTGTGGTSDERLRIDTSGNVGIGTTSPNEPLHIHATTGGQSQLRLTDGNTGSTASDGLLLSIDGSQQSYVWNYENTATIFGTSNTERMRINSGGNVGIGMTPSTSTGYPLQISGGGYTYLELYSTGTTDSGYSSLILKTNSGAANGQIFQHATSATTWGGSNSMNIYSSAGPIAFHPNGLDSSMFIATDGDVGIGTKTPGSYKLNVVGDTYTSGLAMQIGGAITYDKYFGTSTPGTGVGRWVKLLQFEQPGQYYHAHYSIRLSSRYYHSELNIETHTSNPASSADIDQFSITDIDGNGFPESHVTIGRTWTGSTNRYEIWVYTNSWSSLYYNVQQRSGSIVNEVFYTDTNSVSKPSGFTQQIDATDDGYIAGNLAVTGTISSATVGSRFQADSDEDLIFGPVNWAGTDYPGIYSEGPYVMTNDNFYVTDGSNLYVADADESNYIIINNDGTNGRLDVNAGSINLVDPTIIDGTLTVNEADDSIQINAATGIAEVNYNGVGGLWQVGTGYSGTTFGTDAFYFYNGGIRAEIDNDGDFLTAGNLIVQGTYIDDDTTIGEVNDDWIGINGYIQMRSNTDSLGIVLRDKDTSNYLGLTQIDGISYLSDTAGATSYFLRGDGADVGVRGILTPAEDSANLDSYDKIRVYPSSSYTIGMKSSQTFGGLNDWATTFTMNPDAEDDRGWLWRESDDAANDGAMSLTTGGVLTVKSTIYTPSTLRADGGVYVSDDEYFWSDSEDRIATDDSFYVRASSPATYLYSTNTYLGDASGDTIHLRSNVMTGTAFRLEGGGYLRLGSSADPGSWRLFVDGQSYVQDFLRADGGLTTDSTDPGTGNIRAGGDLTVAGGNVGVGTSPNTAYGVHSTGGTSYSIYGQGGGAVGGVYGYTGTGRAIYGYAGGGGYAGYFESGNVYVGATLEIGSDGALYDGGSNVLRTPDSFIIDGALRVGTTTQESNGLTIKSTRGSGSSGYYNHGQLVVIGDTDHAYIQVGTTDSTKEAGIQITNSDDFSNPAYSINMPGSSTNLVFRYGGTSLLTLEGVTEDVGIGTTNPSYKLHVVGDTWSTTGWSSSDIRWKKNITKIGYGLKELMKLKPVNYNWRVDEFKNLSFSNKTQIGFIAQDMEMVIPEVVNTGDDGYKAIAYDKITALNTKAIQELKTEKDEEINALKEENQALKDAICELNPSAKVCLS